MSALFIVLLAFIFVVAYAFYQYKVEKKARQSRYDNVRKRTDMSKPYHALSNPSWPREHVGGD